MREFLASLKKWAVGWLTGGPHFVVGSPGREYLRRWYVLPRNRWLNVYLHQFLRDDDDQARHDHPWWSLSILLKGCYVEDTADGRKLYRAGAVVRRSATHAHRIELPQGKPAWTLFLTGPVVRDWGFVCPQGWRHWKDFVNPSATGEVGRGCD